MDSAELEELLAIVSEQDDVPVSAMDSFDVGGANTIQDNSPSVPKLSERQQGMIECI